jgi:hypothetical protein
MFITHRVFVSVVTIFLSQAIIVASAQTFDCRIVNDGGVEIWGANQIDRVVRCNVKCSYWQTDGTESYQSCTAAMQPNSDSTKYCAFNLNNAKTVIGTSQSCQ